MITTKHCYIMVKIKVVIWKISAKGESVMKKRVTAWLLCVCMLLTATPEVLLASTEAEKQAPEAAVQETERFETEESEAVRTGTEGTESAEPPKEDVEIGSGTEAIPEEPGNDEEIENGGEAEETQTEEAEAPGGIGAEETESVGTEKVEETEESEVPEVSEESGVEEEIATTEETGLTEESETAGEIERTEETEAIEETETGETEEADLTAEELQLLEDEVAMELSALYGMNTRAAGVTEEQIYLLAPVYLANEQYDKIIANCGTMSLEAINSVSETDTIIAAYMHGLKDGSGVLWNEFWASCGLSDSTYQDFETKAAKEVLYEYMRVNKNLKKASDAVEKDLDGFKEVYDLMSDEGKREFTEIIKANKPLLTEAEAEKMAKGLLKQTDTLMKYVDTTAELFVMTVAIAEMQMIELQALDDLIVIHNQVKDPAMRDALARLRTDITTNVETYIVATYVKDDVLKGLQSIVKEAAKKLVPGNIKIHDFEWGLGKLVAKTIASVYESYKPSASDIIYSSLLYQYWMDSNMAVAHYQHLFRMGEGTADDIRYYEAAVNFNAVCTKMLLSKSKKLVKNSNKRLYSRMDCWESSMGSEVNYELYISSCIANATKAVQAGTLVIEQDSATIKDKNGNVIDENHDSTESIKAKFAAIQNQYKPNVGQTWNGNWGGTYQCFGFARMVFSKLFGCEMSNRYVSGEKYKYASESNVNLIGQVSGGNVTAASAQGLLQQGKLGDIIQACGAGNGGQHTMVFVSADANGVTVYDCNTRLSASEPACAIHQWTIGWADWAAWYGTADSNSQNGISLYRASNYAQIYGDGDGMFYDDSVNFVIQNGVLTKYNGWQSFVEIPDTVTAIGDDAFQENTSMVSVSIPDGVKSIGNRAFYGCSALLGVVIPDSVGSIGKSAFQDCSRLASAYLPVNEKFTVVSDGAFSGCKALKGITVPDSVVEIEGSAFYRCENLADVRLSGNIESIGGAAFGYCNKITEIYLPKSLNRDTGSRWYGGAGGPFACCDNLKSVKYEAGLTAIPSAFFQDCSGLEEIVLPDSITVIRSNTFLRCGNLKRIVIPDSVTEIGGAAFKGCVALKAVQIPDTVTDMGIEIFSGCTNLTEVHLPNKLENLPQSTFYNCKKLAAANFPSTLKEIERYAFYGCEALPQAVLPDTVTSIGSEAFYGCEALTDVTLGSGLKVINSKTFCGCTSLTSVVLPYQVASVEDSAFVNCTSLAKITIPRKTTSIASNAFSYPKKLTVYGPTGSYAQQYASQKGIKFVAQDIRATSVRLNVTGKTMEKWDEFQLMATVAPQNFTDEIIWTSSDENVATVSEDGYVEACGGGQAVIAVKAGAAKATCTVTVKQYVNWIEFSDGNISMKAGETRQLAVTISPENATDKRLEYTSSNPAVATVSASGVVTAKKQGETTITAKAKDGSGEYDTCYVTVTGAAKVTGISLNRTSAVVKKGKTLTLQAKITPDYAANKKVTWKSSNTKVATVDGKGKVTGKAAGRATITVISSENSSCKASCTVTVPYTINYKLNKGKNNSKNPDSYYRQKVTLKDPTRKGYAFKGWYTDKKFKNKIKSISKNANKNYTLYAKWEKVTVKKTQISSAKNSRSKQLLLKYKKVQGAKGYEISYSTDKKFKKGVTKKTTGKTSYTIKGLKKGKTYYVRIRAYQVDSTGKKVYGKYSSVKKVKITK